MYRSVITGLAPQRLRGGLVSLAESGSRLVVTSAPVVIGTALTTAEATLTPKAALRWIVIATGVFSGLLGIVCVTIARCSRARQKSTVLWSQQ